MLTHLKDFYLGLTEKGRLFILTLVFCMLAILLSLWIGGLPITLILILPAILSILAVTKEVWAGEGGGKSKIGLASLGIAAVAIGMNEKFKPILDHLLEPLFGLFPGLEKYLPEETSSAIGLLFLLFVILIVNYFARDETAMKEHPTPIEKEFPERDYKKQLELFCASLRNYLRNIDIETNWSAAFFTPLDAEVEVQSGSKRLKKVTDLLTAIRSDRLSRVFLVLGDPS